MLHCENVDQKGEHIVFALYPQQEWSQKLSGAGGWGRIGENNFLKASQLKKLLNVRNQKSETKNAVADQHHTS